MTLRYLLDEHIPKALLRVLRQLDPELVVWRVGQPGAPPLETPDPEILVWCEMHDFILVTNNRASMPEHLAAHLAAGRHLPGLLIVNLTHGLVPIAEELWLAAVASPAEAYQDQVRYLPLG
jgi:predicted nuclease of predicted toxin-antitoxin system